MIIRTIRPEEIDPFCRVGFSDEKAARFRHSLGEAWEEGRSFPEYCFVAEENGEFLASLVFDVFPSTPGDLMLWRCYIPENEAFLDLGREMFAKAFETLKGLNLNSIEYHLYGDGDETYKRKKTLYSLAGFKAVQEKLRYELVGETTQATPARLIYRSLKEVGADKFIEAIMLVTENTLDRYDENEVKTLGAEQAAIGCFNNLRDIDDNDDWWMLGYDTLGGVSGLVVPQQLDDKTGVINYIGVIPQKRGLGIVNELLMIGTETLKHAGCIRIVADTDINNVPMQRALANAGYKLSQKEMVYRRDLV